MGVQLCTNYQQCVKIFLIILTQNMMKIYTTKIRIDEISYALLCIIIHLYIR